MKDNRDPQEVYKELLFHKTGWNLSIVEAADRVEAASTERAQEAPYLTPSGNAGYESPDGEAPQNGAQASVPVSHPGYTSGQ